MYFTARTMTKMFPMAPNEPKNNRPTTPPAAETLSSESDVISKDPGLVLLFDVFMIVRIVEETSSEFRVLSFMFLKQNEMGLQPIKNHLSVKMVCTDEV